MPTRDEIRARRNMVGVRLQVPQAPPPHSPMISNDDDGGDGGGEDEEEEGRLIRSYSYYRGAYAFFDVEKATAM